jgi:hypothetical protein
VSALIAAAHMRQRGTTGLFPTAQAGTHGCEAQVLRGLFAAADQEGDPRSPEVSAVRK